MTLWYVSIVFVTELIGLYLFFVHILSHTVLEGPIGFVDAVALKISLCLIPIIEAVEVGFAVGV